MKDIKAEQCYENCLAFFRYHKLEPPKLLEGGKREDRCYFDWLSYDDGNERGVKVYECLQNKDKFIKYSETNYRESVSQYAAEINFHGSSDEENSIEIDFDRWNPLYGVPYGFMHLTTELVWHWASRTKTNPFTIMRGLRDKRKFEVKDVRKEA